MISKFLTLFASFFGLHAQANCPDPNLHETAADCPWAEVTRQSTGERDPAKLRALFDQTIPGFMTQIDRDGDSPLLLNLWSLSHNVDESNLANGTLTIPANLIEFFVSLWHVPYLADHTVGHAGLNHTYGYLLSNLYTPYGFKRARYVAVELEAGLGLTPGLLGGLPPEGTLLSNLTLFASKIAFRDDPKARTQVQKALSQGDIVPVKELLEYPYSSLKAERLVEEVETPAFKLRLNTDIVSFSHAQTKGSDTALLIYSYQFKESKNQASARLVTAFPVQASFAKGLFDPGTFGTNQPIKLKYNLALPVSIPAETMVGKRFLFHESKGN